MYICIFVCMYIRIYLINPGQAKERQPSSQFVGPFLSDARSMRLRACSPEGRHRGSDITGVELHLEVVMVVIVGYC